MVKIILANLEKASSTLSPDSADTSIDTGMPLIEAQCAASSADTSRPSGAIVAVFRAPNDMDFEEFIDPREVFGRLAKEVDGVSMGLSRSDGSGVSKLSSVKSALLPTSTVIRFGEARARASFKNVGREWKECLEQTS